MHYKRFDIVLVSLFLAVALFSFNKLYIDKYSTFQKDSSKLAATIVDTFNTVKRKPASHLAWNDAYKSDKLYYFDKVYTHKNSNTKIQFSNDLVIDLQENTLLQITEKNNTPQIILKDGVIYLKFTSKKKSKIKIIYKKKELSITSAKSEIAIQGEGSKIKVSAIDGDATISSPSETIQLMPNQAIEVIEDQVDDEPLIIKPVSLILKTPLNNKIIDLPLNDKKVTLRWNSSDVIDDTKLLVSKSRDFANILEKITITSVSSYDLHNLLDGGYYWKIISGESSSNTYFFQINNETTLPEAEEISIDINESEYKLTFDKVSPPEDSTIIIPSPTNQISFSWDFRDETDSGDIYIQISKDMNFNTVVAEDRVEETRYRWKKPLLGRFYWRIVNKGDAEDILYGQPTSFKVEMPKPLPAPTIDEAPESIDIQMERNSSTYNNIIKSIFQILIPTSYAEEKYVQTATISWPKQDKASNYTIEIYDSSEMSEMITSKVVYGPSFKWLNPVNGTVFWRISSADKWGQSSPFSPLSKLEIVLPKSILVPDTIVQRTPMHRAKIPIAKAKRTTFKWKRDNRIKKYFFEISRSLDFSRPIVKKSTKRNRIRIDLTNLDSPKGYFWRISGIDKFGRRTKSKRRHITVLELKKAKRPKKKEFVLKTSPLPEIKNRYNANFFLTPSSTTIEQKGSTAVFDLSGTIVTAIRIDAGYKTGFHNNYHASFSRLTGEVFGNQNLEQTSISVLRGQKFFDYGISVSRYSAYKKVTTTITSEETVTLFQALGGAHYNIPHSSWSESSVKGILGIGTAMGIEAIYNFAIKFGESIRIIAGLSYERKTFDNDNSDVTSSNIKAAIGSGISF